MFVDGDDNAFEGGEGGGDGYGAFEVEAGGGDDHGKKYAAAEEDDIDV